MPLVKSLNFTASGLILPPRSDRRYLLRSFYANGLSTATHVLFFGPSYSDTDPPYNYGRIIASKYLTTLLAFSDQRKTVDYRFPVDSKLFLSDVGEGVGYWLSTGSLKPGAFIRFEEVFV